MNYKYFTRQALIDALESAMDDAEYYEDASNSNRQSAIGILADLDASRATVTRLRNERNGLSAELNRIDDELVTLRMTVTRNKNYARLLEMYDSIPASVLGAVECLMSFGQKIVAIKHLRQYTDFGLKDAKDIVEAFIQ